VPSSRYQLAFISPPLISLLNLSSSRPVFNGVKAINTSVNRPGTPPRHSLGPYKRRAPSPSFTAPLPAPISLSPRMSSPLTERHCLLILHHHRPASSAPLSVLRPRRRALAPRSGQRPSSGERDAVPSVRADVGTRWTEHTRPIHRDVDPVYGFTRWKLIHYSDYSEILQRGPWTFVKSTRGPDFCRFCTQTPRVF
jgi:hypothetical protein